MKRFATAVLLLFVASLLSSAFASSCMAMPRANAGVEMQARPCCAMKVACMGGACSSSAHHVGCTSQTGWFAVSQKDELGGFIKFVPPVVIWIPSLTLVAHATTPPRVPFHEHAGIVGYDDVYARTGRLLI